MRIFRSLKSNHKSQGFGKENTFPYLMSAYESLGLKGHNGVDWVCGLGEKIYWDCSIRGTVISTCNDTTAGVGCEIITEDQDGIFKHIFWHFKLDGLIVQAGQVLETGNLIGYGDSTGMSTGNHLHRGLKKQAKDELGRYYTPDKENGYKGAIDDSPYFTNIFVLDYMDTLKKQIFIISEIIKLMRRLLSR